jgi:hypothetical protein
VLNTISHCTFMGKIRTGARYASPNITETFIELSTDWARASRHSPPKSEPQIPFNSAPNGTQIDVAFIKVYRIGQVSPREEKFRFLAKCAFRERAIPAKPSLFSLRIREPLEYVRGIGKCLCTSGTSHGARACLNIPMLYLSRCTGSRLTRMHPKTLRRGCLRR